MSKKNAPPPKETEKQLFDYVLVVALKSEGTKPVPYVHYRFPPAVKDKDTLADAIVQFCFPEAELWMDPKALIEKQKRGGETFSFVLTESDGSRKFGYCRRMVVKGPKGELSPECYCILSFLPCFSLFVKMLNIVEDLRSNKSASAVFSFLKAVLAKSFPNPGEKLSVRTFETDTYELERSDNDYLLDIVSFKDIFKLKVGTILDIFAALLLESRVIICSKNVSSLSSAVYALTALLYPFNWQHVYIPILPKSLMSYCCAPMPFFVGILESNMAELNTYPIEEAVLFDVDTGKFLKPIPAACDYKKMLPVAATMLKRNVKALLKSGQSAKATDLSIASSFLQFFYYTLADFETFLVDHKFNRDAFYASRGKDVQKFLDTFSTSQMYEMFIREIEERSRNGTLDQFPLSKTKFSKTTLKTLESLETQKGIRKCHTCGDEVTEGRDFKERFYCEKCFQEKKLSKRDKFKSILYPSSMPNLKRASGETSPTTGRKGEEKAKGKSFLGLITRSKDKEEEPDPEPMIPDRSSSPSPIQNRSSYSASVSGPSTGTTKVSQMVHSINEPSKVDISPALSSSPTPGKVSAFVKSVNAANEAPSSRPSLDISKLPTNTNQANTVQLNKPLPTTPRPTDPGSRLSVFPGTNGSPPTPRPTSLSTSPLSRLGANFCNECGSKLDNSGVCPKCNKPVSKRNSANAKLENICEGCKKPFLNETVMNAGGKQWHKACLVCTACGKPFTDTFALKDGKPYHTECAKPKCAKCDQILSTKAVVVENKKYHEHCFLCKNCESSLAGQPYLLKNNEPWCRKCAIANA